MEFRREWDFSCPHIFEEWDSEGTHYVIQDLAPEDDEDGLHILEHHLLPDEILCSTLGISNDPYSVTACLNVWRNMLSLRTSIGCYAERDGQRKLVGLNVCLIHTQGDSKELVDKAAREGGPIEQLWKTINYINARVDAHACLGLDRVLDAFGLCVVREHRGARLGYRILAAREPLCKLLGIKGTSTLFTGPASQKLAARCGFKSFVEISLKEFHEVGLKFPPDESKVIKVMMKKYED